MKAIDRAEEVETIEKQTNCHNCGAPLVFDIKNRILHCEYCHTVIPPDEVFSGDDGKQFKENLMLYLKKLSVWNKASLIPSLLLATAFSVFLVEATKEMQASDTLCIAMLLAMAATILISPVILVLTRPKAPAPVKRISKAEVVFKQLGMYAAALSLVIVVFCIVTSFIDNLRR